MSAPDAGSPRLHISVSAREPGSREPRAVVSLAGKACAGDCASFRRLLDLEAARRAGQIIVDLYESAVCEAIVRAVLRLAGDREVTHIRARVGGHPVDPDVIRRCVEDAVAGTVAEHAVVDLVLDPPAVRCLACGNETATGYALALLACRQCGSPDIEVSGTEDLTLESVEITE